MNADSTSTAATATAATAAPASAADPAGPGDKLVRVGAIVFAVGALATIATVLPLFLGLHRLPTPAYFVCMTMPLGFAIALVGLLRSARSQRRVTAE